jgi:hypothetical protein
MSNMLPAPLCALAALRDTFFFFSRKDAKPQRKVILLLACRQAGLLILVS